MYHAVGDGVVGHDPVYRVSRETFRAQLDKVRACSLQTTTVRDVVADRVKATHEPAVVLGFDDGDLCHAETVVPMLLENGCIGEFFVNSANAGSRGFADWNMLRAMADVGMSVQSHGHSHRYMDELDETCLMNELLRAKHLIEDRTGYEVTVLAAPGGRINARIAALAHAAGYRACCGSRPGYWRLADGSAHVIPRLAVHANTGLETFCGWLKGERRSVLAMQFRYETLRFAKRLLGNTAYDNLRSRILGGGEHTAPGSRRGA